jgi:hypothetical protein
MTQTTLNWWSELPLDAKWEYEVSFSSGWWIGGGMNMSSRILCNGKVACFVTINLDDVLGCIPSGECSCCWCEEE